MYTEYISIIYYAVEKSLGFAMLSRGRCCNFIFGQNCNETVGYNVGRWRGELASVLGINYTNILTNYNGGG